MKGQIIGLSPFCRSSHVYLKVYTQLYNQLYKYLDRQKFLYKHQSGFRSIHSVATCLLSSTNEWYLNLDDKKYTGMVFIDLKKHLIPWTTLF